MNSDCNLNELQLNNLIREELELLIRKMEYALGNAYCHVVAIHNQVDAHVLHEEPISWDDIMLQLNWAEKSIEESGIAPGMTDTSTY